MAQTATNRAGEPLLLGPTAVTVQDVVDVARHDRRVAISGEALDSVARTRVLIDDLAASEQPVYGVSTGFGALANRYIAADMRAQLQRSLIRSHAAGSGDRGRA